MGLVEGEVAFVEEVGDSIAVLAVTEEIKDWALQEHHRVRSATIAGRKVTGRRTVLNVRQKKPEMNDGEDHRNLPLWPKSHN